MLEFKKASREDIPKLAQLFFESRLNLYYKRSLAVLKKDLEIGIERDQIIVCVDENKECCGYIRYNLNSEFGGGFPYLDTLIVDEKKQACGIGKKLYRYMEREACEQRWHTKIFCNVVARNEMSQIFWQKLGYIPIGRVDNLFKKGIDEILMVKEVEYDTTK